MKLHVGKKRSREQSLEGWWDSGYEFQVSRQDDVKTKLSRYKTVQGLKGAKLRDRDRSRFAMAGDISETKFFPVVKLKVS